MSSRRYHWWRRARGAAPPAAPGTPAPPGPGESLASDPRDQEAAVLSRLHDYVRVQVRSAVFDRAELRQITIEAALEEAGEPTYADLLARRVLSAELTDWYAEAATWTGRTDPERLDSALGQVASDGVLVLPAIPEPAQIAEARRVRGSARGTVAYSVGDIWDALDHHELPLTVLDGDGQRVARGAPLLSHVMDALAGQGLLAHALGTPAAVVVPLYWRRRPADLDPTGGP